MIIEEIEKHVAVSKCGKYVYPVDCITGAKTFAPIAYFIKKLKDKYQNNLETFVKEYKTRETKKYLKEGYSPEEILEIAQKHKGLKLPKIDVKLPKESRNTTKKSNQGESVATANGETIVIYPWSNDPQNYFRDDTVALNITEATKDTCLRPDLNLDAQCEGCKYYNDCQCPLKYVNKRNEKGR